MHPIHVVPVGLRNVSTGYDALPHWTHLFPAGGAWLRVASERVSERVSALVRWMGDIAGDE